VKFFRKKQAQSEDKFIEGDFLRKKLHL